MPRPQGHGSDERRLEKEYPRRRHHIFSDEQPISSCEHVIVLFRAEVRSNPGPDKVISCVARFTLESYVSGLCDVVRGFRPVSRRARWKVAEARRNGTAVTALCHVRRTSRTHVNPFRSCQSRAPNDGGPPGAVPSWRCSVAPGAPHALPTCRVSP